MSVPASIILCLVWHYAIVHPHEDDAVLEVQPWSFADNWELSSSDPHALGCAIKTTMEFLHSWKPQPDISKSWAWSTKPMKNEVKDRFSQLVSEHGQLLFLSGAKDLGAAVRYQKLIFLDPIKERFQKVAARAKILCGFPSGFAHKWRAIIMGLNPAAPYGLEISCIGKRHFQMIRTSVADVLSEGHSNRNEFLAGITHPTVVGDIEVVAIKRCFKACRIFLLRNPDRHEEFLKLLHKIPGDPRNAHGPTGTLKRWILRLGWSVLPSGSIRTHAHVVITIDCTPYELIFRLVDDAWALVVAAEISNRKGLENIPHFNIPLSAKSLQKFDEAEQSICSKYFMSAFTAADKAKHWQEHGRCRWCDHEDSIAHRFFECPALAVTRFEHKETVDAVREQCPFWANAPLIPRHQDEDKWTQLCSTFRLPQPDHVLEGTHCEDKLFTFYTDGSCKNPTCKEGSVASWTVIADSAENDSHRKEIVTAFLTNQEDPTTLIHVGSGEVPLLQSNDRAELCAVIVALALAKRVCIYSDSQYALDILQQTIDSQANLQSLHHLANYDLILELILVVAGRGRNLVSWHHVRAHQTVDSFDDPLDQYHCVANAIADQYAKLFIDKMDTEFPDAIAEHYVYWRSLHLAYLKYCVAATRAISAFKEDVEPAPEQPVPVDPIAKLLGWEPTAPIKFDFDITRQQLLHFPQPPNFMVAVVTWAKSLSWPSNKVATDCGISWIELLVDFRLATGVMCPRQLGKCRNVHRYAEVTRGSAEHL